MIAKSSCIGYNEKYALLHMRMQTPQLWATEEKDGMDHDHTI